MVALLKVKQRRLNLLNQNPVGVHQEVLVEVIREVPVEVLVAVDVQI